MDYTTNNHNKNNYNHLLFSPSTSSSTSNNIGYSSAGDPSSSSSSSNSRATRPVSQRSLAPPIQLSRSVSTSALVGGSGSSNSGGGGTAAGSSGSTSASRKLSATGLASSASQRPPVPDIPSFLKSANSFAGANSQSNFNNSSFISSPDLFRIPNYGNNNSLSTSRPGSAKLTIDTNLSNNYGKPNRTVSDSRALGSNQLASASTSNLKRSKSGAAGDDRIDLGGRGGGTSRKDRDRHGLVVPEQSNFRNSLVDNLLLDFDKLGQDFSCDPSFDRFLDPYYDPEEVAYQQEAAPTPYTSYDYARNRLHSRQRSASNPTFAASHRYYDAQHSPKQVYTEEPEEEDDYNRNGTLVYTSDGRFITTPPQSRRGPPPSRQQSYPFGPSFEAGAPTPVVSNRSRAREEVPRQPNHLQRRRSTKSNKSLRRATDAMTEHSTLPTIPSEMQSEPQVVAKPASKPGFFRRVFGGGTTKPVPTIPPPPQTADGGDKVADSVKRQASAPPATAASTGPENVPPRTPQLVTKKSSGFFRRRKKSVSEHEPVPALPASITHHNYEIENSHASPTSFRQPVDSYGNGTNSRPETAASRSQSRTQVSRHEREMSDASILPNVVTSSPNNRNPTSRDSRRPTIRSIESELPNRILAYKDGESEKITTAAGITNADIEAAPPMTKDMYTPRKPETKTPVKSPPSSSTAKKARQYEGSFLRDDDSDSSNEAGSSTNLAPDMNGKDLEKSKSHETQSSSTASDVFYDAASGRKSSVTDPRIDSSMPVVVLPQSEDEDDRRRDDPNATPRAKKILNIAEEEDEGEPSTEEKDAAKKIFDGDESFLPKGKAAAWLGESGAPSARIRKAYMAMFDWTSMNILAAFRSLCERLVLKGETQQVDRIVAAVAKRWCECNFNHGFKSVDVVHTIIYSILLVNTDLHMADIPSSQRMTKNQFVKNTLSTIRRGLASDDSDAPQSMARSQTPYEQDDDDGLHPSSRNGPEPTLTKRLSFIHGSAVRNLFGDQSNGLGDLADGNGTGGDTGGPLINAPHLQSSMRTWEFIVETVLKEFYMSIRAAMLPLHGVTSNTDKSPDSATPPNNSLGVRELRRTNSTVSKAPSESSMSLRMERYGTYSSSIGNNSTSRLGSKWKNRSRPRLYPGSFAGSSRTSFDDRLWSPSASSTWSKYSLDKTATSMMSTDSLGSGFGQGDYMQSIGFANALSTAIIREETAGFPSDDGEQSIQATVLDDDIDELALYGSPWAKEGMVKHKHHLESTDKRAKNRGWVECFAVVEKGWMRLFQFHNDKKKITSGIVGGGNWMQNAEPIGSFMLRHTIASELPPPGYSKARPHVFALSLPSGAVHFFQVGTTEIVKEWVGAANYWSARLSKEPLVGGVSNIEYGWSNCIDIDAFTQNQSPPSTGVGGPRPSFQGSIRSSMDHHGGYKARLPGDKATIADWTPPSQSMYPSPFNEGDQLRALEGYVSNIEKDLQKHNELRGPMLLAFTPRHPNYNKAMNNWERKSSYLLREIVKFRTYIDALTAASVAKEKIFTEKEQRARELAADKMQTTESSTDTISPPDTRIQA